MKFITLLTDFGLLDGYPGVMKGVIYGIAPDAQIADITHLISPQNVQEGALALFRSYRYFPAGTIHVAVVDPGVGTRRRAIVLKAGGHFFIGPDNGLFTLVLQEAAENHWQMEMVNLDQPEYFLTEVSSVFHGRDIFAPVAAHIANGVSLLKMGTLIHDPVFLPVIHPEPISNGFKGQVVVVDHFGNLSTNLLSKHLAGLKNLTVEVAGKKILGLIHTFGDRNPGDLVAMIGTDDDLTISIVNGNASQVLGVGFGAEILLTGEPAE